MTNMLIKKYFNSVVVWEMDIKVTVSYDFTLIKLLLAIGV